MRQLSTVILTNDNEYCVADANIKSWFNSWIERTDGSNTIKIASEMQLLYIRNCVKNKLVTPFTLIIASTKNKYDSDADGRFKNWPPELSLLDELLYGLF